MCILYFFIISLSLSLCVCVCVYIYIYIYMCVYIYICVCVFKYLNETFDHWFKPHDPNISHVHKLVQESVTGSNDSWPEVLLLTKTETIKNNFW